MVRLLESFSLFSFLLIEIPAYDAFIRRVMGRRWRQFISDHDRFYTGRVMGALLESAAPAEAATVERVEKALHVRAS